MAVLRLVACILEKGPNFAHTGRGHGPEQLNALGCPNAVGENLERFWAVQGDSGARLDLVQLGPGLHFGCRWGRQIPLISRFSRGIVLFFELAPQGFGVFDAVLAGQFFEMVPERFPITAPWGAMGGFFLSSLHLICRDVT